MLAFDFIKPKIWPRSDKGYLTYLALAFIGVMLIVGLTFVNYTANGYKSAKNIYRAQSAQYLAQAGLEKAIWSLNNVGNYAGETNTPFGDGQFSVVITNLSANTKNIVATGAVPSFSASQSIKRTVRATVDINNTIISFNYGVQAGNGGFTMGNNSLINGNVYANGTIVGGNGAQINGDAFSASASGKIEKITVNGVAKAHTLKDCTVNGAAYYAVNQNCQLAGQSFPNSPDPLPQEMPIDEDQITAWQELALSGGTHNGNYTINADLSLGPKKINGNLIVDNNITLTITGTIWVTGTISLGNDDIIKLDESYGSNSEVIITDGVISLGNSATFTPASVDGYILLLTRASGTAISLGNSASAAILYAPNGTISVGNNIELKEITAYGINLGNGSVLNYDSGLASTAFSGGPGAAWAFAPGSYISE